MKKMLIACFKSLFHFLGGLYLAIALIIVAILTVTIGTLIESKTGSHLLAAQWTYDHPFFYFLLFLLFINILFSSLRRWPFQKRHIPFLMTHLGLLMMIAGAIIKNLLGMQGQMKIWEGSGNQQVLIPYTYALLIDKKEQSSWSESHTIDLNNFLPHTYSPPSSSQLVCKVIGYAPHKARFQNLDKRILCSYYRFPPNPRS